MIVGKPPYEADTPMAVALAHIHEPLPTPQSINPSVSDAVQAVLLKTLAKDPDGRYQTAVSMSTALYTAVSSNPASTADQGDTLQLLVADAQTTPITSTRPADPGNPGEGRRLPLPLIAGGAIGALAVVAIALLVLTGVLLPDDEGAAAAEPVDTPVVQSDEPAAQAGETAAEDQPPGEEEPTGATITKAGEYDNFEGSVINRSLWTDTEEPGCDFDQGEGILRIEGGPNDQYGACNLVLAYSPELNAFTGLAADINLQGDYTGTELGFALRVYALLEDGSAFNVDCGLAATTPGEPVTTFLGVADGRIEGDPLVDYVADVFVEPDAWTTIQLDHQAGENLFTCSINGETIATYDAMALDGAITLTLNSWRSAESQGTILVDNISLP
ncbi:MAG: hypothetical protein ACFB51_11160 [Anaerolineae bacterium]